MVSDRLVKKIVLLAMNKDLFLYQTIEIAIKIFCFEISIVIEMYILTRADM